MNKEEEQRNFLNNNDYVLGNYHDLTNSRQKEYFVKNRPPEGPLHTFYVDLLYQEIKKHTDKVWKKRTKEPDIIFINKKKQEVVIEVESAIDVKKKKKYHNEKFSNLKKKYGENSYIFLPSKPSRFSYKRHNVPLLFRLDINKFIQSQFNIRKK